MKSPKILLVEDDGIISLAETKGLRSLGYVIIQAQDGETALQAVNDTADIDIILMDIELGNGLDGIETAKEINNKRDVPVIFLSNCGDCTVLKKLDTVYHYGFVNKTSELEVINTAIKTALKLHKRIKESNTGKEDTYRMKLAHLSYLAHELRTPVHNITGMLQLAMDEHSICNIHDLLKKTQVSAGHLRYLVNDILDYGKFETNELCVENNVINIREFMDEIAAMFSWELKMKNIDFILNVGENVPSHVKSDKNKLKQVLINIVSNAVKYTEEGKIELHVNVRNDCMSFKKDFLDFTVSDTGIGISPDFQYDIFKPYFTLNENSQNSAGLGLYISKKIIEALKGKLSFSNNGGKGSTFSVFIPIKNHSCGNEELKRKYFMDTAAVYNILIVDDDQINRMLLESCLTNMGHAVICARDGNEALKYFLENKLEYIDLILMDIEMPGMNGIDVISRLKIITGGKVTEEIPVLGITAYGSDYINEQGSISCFNCILNKPFKLESLSSKISEVMEKKDKCLENKN